MDWKQVIERNREALLGIVAGLMVLMGQSETLAHPLRRSILRILRPAESALRRLIVIFAAVYRAKAPKGEGVKQPLPEFSTFAQKERQSAFALIDPRKRFGGLARPFSAVAPRISVPGLSDAVRPTKPDDATRAKTLYRRIETFEAALKTLPRQARRLRRLLARRATAEPGPGRVGPIRPGHPPGFRKRAIEPVDDILRDCHCLALECSFKPP